MGGYLPSEIKPLTVQEVTRLIKERLEHEPALRRVYVRGEVSNCRRHSASGHLYFTLKDEVARLKCVMFRSRCTNLGWQVEDGLDVIAFGSIGVYEAGGEYQLYVEELVPAGQGSLHLAFEQLKKKLEAEGLFQRERKRPIPRFPQIIGVVTSLDGAAIRDIITVTTRRWPGVHLVISPAVVQGEEGPTSVVEALERLVSWPGVEVIIVGRGGGSMEELWTFNDERVARAIYACPVPVISAVGHETDFTIADFVADLRAPTPSAAAEMAVPDLREIQGALASFQRRLIQTIRHRMADKEAAFLRLWQGRAQGVMLDRLRQRSQLLDDYLFRMGAALRKKTRKGRQDLWERTVTLMVAGPRLVSARREQIQRLRQVLLPLGKNYLKEKRLKILPLISKLDSLSPLKTLQRGYSICRRERDGLVVRDPAQVEIDERVEVIIEKGVLRCAVKDTRVRE